MLVSIRACLVCRPYRVPLTISRRILGRIKDEAHLGGAQCLQHLRLEIAGLCGGGFSPPSTSNHPARVEE